MGIGTNRLMSNIKGRRTRGIKYLKWNREESKIRRKQNAKEKLIDRFQWGRRKSLAAEWSDSPHVWYFRSRAGRSDDIIQRVALGLDIKVK